MTADDVRKDRDKREREKEQEKEREREREKRKKNIKGVKIVLIMMIKCCHSSY